MTTSNEYSGGFKYAVDIVFVIDVTGSMGPVIEAVKENVRSFHTLLGAAMAEKGKAISQLRVRVIAYRDFADKPSNAVEATGFLALPDQQGQFESFVQRLHAIDGGDEPESGLEALSVAIDSDWERGLDRRRHVIALFTDASAHPLGDPKARAAATYPQTAPSTIDELFERWGYASSQTATMENSAKRLLLFAPDTMPWNVIAADWNNAIFLPSKAGDGLEEVEMQEIINAIANSI
ncbi:MAG: von Willebrand factor type [Actinomycetia bacterium]|nr:von Willebrand factor type [Actinomycetes bacterium]